MYLGRLPQQQTYGLEGHVRNFGNGGNLYRGDDFTQPRGLIMGDRLSNGWEVFEVYSSFNSSVGVEFTNGKRRILAPRLPLQLLSDKQGVLPINLRVGQILQTGCVVLDTPKAVEPVRWHNNQNETMVTLTGGLHGHQVRVPDDIELALFDEEFPPNPESVLGSYSLRMMQRMQTSGELKVT